MSTSPTWHAPGIYGLEYFFKCYALDSFAIRQNARTAVNIDENRFPAFHMCFELRKEFSCRRCNWWFKTITEIRALRFSFGNWMILAVTERRILRCSLFFEGKKSRAPKCAKTCRKVTKMVPNGGTHFQKGRWARALGPPSLGYNLWPMGKLPMGIGNG